MFLSILATHEFLESITRPTEHLYLTEDQDGPGKRIQSKGPLPSALIHTIVLVIPPGLLFIGADLTVLF